MATEDANAGKRNIIHRTFTTSIIQHDFIVKAFLHVSVPIILSRGTFGSLSKPFLPTEFAVVYFSTIGWTVPWQLFGLISVGLISFLPFLVEPTTNYTIMLYVSVGLTLIEGRAKLREIQNLQKNDKDDDDDDDDDDDEDDYRPTVEPVAPGTELESLREAEARQRRERQRACVQARDHLRTYTKVPLESVDAII